MEIFSASVTHGPVPEPIGRRAIIFIGVVAFHICVIVLLVLSRQAVQQSKNQGVLSVFALAVSPSPPSIPIPAPIIPAEAMPMISSPAEAHAEQQIAEGDPDGEVCSPLDAVTFHLASDPLVPLAINRVARADRSISEAIVMWNAEWSVVAANEQAPLADVRNRVLLILETLPPDCLATPVIGPRLIAIPEEGSTTFLAFGSGKWSWQQLIEPPDKPSSKDNEWNWEQLLNGELPPIF